MMERVIVSHRVRRSVRARGMSFGSGNAGGRVGLDHPTRSGDGSSRAAKAGHEGTSRGSNVAGRFAQHPPCVLPDAHGMHRHCAVVAHVSIACWTASRGRRDYQGFLPIAARCFAPFRGRATADAIPLAIPVLIATLLPTFRHPPREPIRSTDFAGCADPFDSSWGVRSPA